MILITDSGSTKCSWALCDKQSNILFKCETIGFNPYFIDQEKILETLNNSGLTEYKNEVEKVYFYGAGCSSDEKNKIIHKPLDIFFKNAKVHINHDLDAACYAMYKGKPNITCILGTGSNTCYFDGVKIVENGPSLGFMLGDEGSGNYFGKIILNYYFNNKFSRKLKQKFENDYDICFSEVMKNIYNNNRANVYLSKFFPFVSTNKNDKEIREIIYKGLTNFFETHVCCYKNHKNVDINFIGSVSFFLKNEIIEIAKRYNCNVKNIVRNPIKDLIKFHFREKNTFIES